MFWKYNHTTSPHIETLLNKDDVTLRELMDQEDVLQECKVQNKKLLEYLLRPDIMEELVTLTISEPTDENDEKSKYKYPNIACELLICDVSALNERLAADEALLGKLYSFLETEEPLNPLLASFFSKTIGMLVIRKSEQNWYSYQFTCLQVLEFLKSKENCVKLMLKHIGTSAIMDLMLKLITQIEGPDMRQNILNWFDSQQVIQNVVALLDPSTDPDKHSNAAQLLCDIIKVSRENQYASTERMDPNPILNTIESYETVTQLLNHILGSTKCESSIVGGISILLTLLDFNRNNTSTAGAGGGGTGGGGGQGEDGSHSENDHPRKVIINTTSAILLRLKDFHDLLINPPPKDPVRTTVGVLDVPLGNTRLHVAKLVAALIATGLSECDRELASLGTVQVLLDLFFKYTWNNFLHSQVEQCLAFALNTEHQASINENGDPNEYTLLNNIFVNCRLLQRILEAWDDNESQQAQTGGLRRGYMGHLIKMANHVAQHAEKLPVGQILKEHVPADTLAAWEAFVANVLAETNKTHQLFLGGHHPGHSSSEDDEPEFRDVSFPQDSSLQQVYTDYQLQQMAPQFIESYGFQDDEFTEVEDILHGGSSASGPDGGLGAIMFDLNEEEMDRRAEVFEQACQQHLRTFDDPEEDLWDERDQDLTFQTVIEARTSEWLDGGNNPKEVPRTSCSDEEDRPPHELQMDIDTNPWGNSGETPTAPIAVDAGNPWAGGGGGGDSGELTPTDQNNPDGWADFGSAAFPTNFESTNVIETSLNDINTSETSNKSIERNLDSQPGNTEEDSHTNMSNMSEMMIAVTEVAHQLFALGTNDDVKDIETPHLNQSLDEQSSPLAQADTNANPSTPPPDVQDNDQLIDNFRFLSSQGMINSSSNSEETNPASSTISETIEQPPAKPL